MDFVTPYLGRKRTRTTNTEPTLTKQNHKKECDINHIMKKYQKTGTLDHVSTHSSEYGFASSIQFHDAANLVIKATDMFDALPSSLRKRFNHDPAQFLDFVQDPANESEMIKLGLAVSREIPSHPDDQPDLPIVPAAEAPSDTPPEPAS